MFKHSTVLFLFFLLIFSFIYKTDFKPTEITGAPPYGEPEINAPSGSVLPWLSDWKRPEGPAKVAIQVGHWKSDEHPEELKRLRGNSGARGGGKVEWEVNYAIAEIIKNNLEKLGIETELLPATVSPAYWADVFISIHADGSTDPAKSGFKIAAPWRDYTKNAELLVSLLENEYEAVTGFKKDPNITRNMRGYYAFSWWRYEHAIHPMTTAAIVETGFLTSVEDRKIIVNSPEISAEGITNGLIKYLQMKDLF